MTDITMPKSTYKVTLDIRFEYEIELPNDSYKTEGDEYITDISEAIEVDKEMLSEDLGNEVLDDGVKKWKWEKVS